MKRKVLKSRVHGLSLPTNRSFSKRNKRARLIFLSSGFSVFSLFKITGTENSAANFYTVANIFANVFGFNGDLCRNCCCKNNREKKR
jgi:hypothetical protein